MKKLLLVIFFTTLGTICYGQLSTDFVTIWKTDNENNNLTYWPNNREGATNPSANNEVVLPLQGRAKSSSYTVIWYNGTGEEAGRQTFTTTVANAVNNFKITWDTPGTYKVAIRNNTTNAVKFRFGNIVTNGSTATANTDRKSKDRLKIINISQWGNLTWDDTHAFNACANLDVTAKDTPVLTGSLEGFFQRCTNLVGTSKFSEWNTANVTRMNLFFGEAAKFNQPIGNWDVRKITTAQSMFSGAAKFNQNLAGWSLEGEGLVSVSSMFAGCNELSCENITLTIISWASNPKLKTGLTLNNLPNKLTHGNMDAYNTLTRAIDEGGKGWKLYNGTTGTFKYDPTCMPYSTLPVTFANLKASLINGELLVQWQTVSEQNNDKFIIKASKDGKNWQEIATVNSKADNGNSNEVLEYEHTIQLSALQLAGAPVLLTLVLAALLFSRRKRLFISMALVTGVFFTGCNSGSLSLEEIDKDVIYVKIQQIDKDGETSSDSNVVYAVKEK